MPSTRRIFQPGPRRAERLHDAVERLHATLAVDEGAGGLGEGRRRQQDVRGRMARRERRHRHDELGRRERGARLRRSRAVEFGLGMQQQVGAARRGEHRLRVEAAVAGQRADQGGARRRSPRRRACRASRRSGPPAPARARAVCAASGCWTARLPSRIARFVPARRLAAIAWAAARGLDAVQGGRHRLARARAQRRPRSPRASAANCDGGTIALCATGMSQSSSTACSDATSAPRFAACRRRCATSGWSLRRKLPTSSTRSSAEIVRDRQAEPGNALERAVVAEVDLPQPVVDVRAAETAHQARREAEFLERRVRRGHERERVAAVLRRRRP